MQLSRPVVLDGTSAWFLRYDDVSDTDDKAVIMGWGATQVNCTILNMLHYKITIKKKLNFTIL